MLTFSQFLAEQESSTELKDFLKKNCAPFCSDAKVFKHGDFLARAATKLPASFKPIDLTINGKSFNAGIASIRKDREPAALSLSMTRAIDDWFEKEYEVRPRTSSMFCVSTINGATASSIYGHLNFLVFPIGDYSIAWSDNVKDLYATNIDAQVDYTGDPIVKEVEAYLNKLNYKVGSAKQALTSDAELMVMADKVLMVEYDPDNNEKNEISAAISA